MGANMAAVRAVSSDAARRIPAPAEGEVFHWLLPTKVGILVQCKRTATGEGGVRMSERHETSRPLPELPHRQPGSAVACVFWLTALRVLALVLGVAGHALAGPLDELSDQTTLGAAELVESDLFDEQPDSRLGEQLHEWSGPALQLGFSFVAGFSIGYALAFFLKLTLAFVGGLLAVLFGLQYVGLVEVNWLGIEAYYDSATAWLRPHAGSFREFIVRNGPSAGMAGLGLMLGLRKK